MIEIKIFDNDGKSSLEDMLQRAGKGASPVLSLK
jgi:hypothetical protein